MLCPFCRHEDSKVIDSRDSADSIRRRRECANCDRRFTTYERAEARSLRVVKQDGRREDFAREKLLDSLAKACVKRPLPTGTLEKVAEEIENHLMDTGRSEVSTKVIGESAVERLKGLDPVAYVRFVSVYKDFRDIEGFKETIEALLDPEEEPQETSSQLTLLPEDAITPRRRAGRSRRRVAALPGK